jgi:hypothetical protein
MTFLSARTLAGCLLLIASFAPVAGAALRERITTTSFTLPAALEPSVSSFHLWTKHTLGPRLYHEALPDGRTMVGWTDASMNGHVSVLSGDRVQATFDFPAEPVRGLAAHADGSFAVLLWNRGGTGYQDDYMRVSKRSATGGQLWSTTVTTTDIVPNPAVFNIGDARLAYAAGVYGAYLSVRNSGGHEGDRYQRVSDTGAVLSGGWGWGLSHSMSGIIAAHPETGRLHTSGASDCYPSKALLFDKNTVLFSADADCAGKVSVQIGQMAAAPGSAWMIAMNAEDRPGYPARGVGVVRIRPGGSPVLRWLTNSTGTDLRDPVIARIGTKVGSNRYLMGWRSLTDGKVRLAVMDTNATMLTGPEVLDGITWGARDDSYRTRPDGSVSWVEGAAGTRTLRLHRYSEAASVAVEGERPAVTPMAMLPPQPNPSRGGMVTLRFRLDRAATVRLHIQDAAGRVVRELEQGERSAGPHEARWDGRDAAGRPVHSGVYFATVATETGRATTRLLVTR